MESVFLHLLNMSITAGWLVLAVMVLRLLMKRAPRWMVCLLWVLVAVRLICPVSVESVLSLIPSTETVPTDVVMGSTPTINSGVPVVDAVVNPIISDTLAPTPEYSADPVQIATFVGANVWVLGMVVMLLYALISTLRLRWQVRESACLRRNIRQCDRVATPFILGIIRPRIYLPSTLSAQDALSVVAHEEAHIQRRDHWWKPLGYLLLTVYWFNPLLWVGYILLCRGIEAACDERVIRDMDMEQRRRYSEALLACSMPRRMISACPLAFGETGVKSRIKSVLSYKKPTFWIVLLAVVLSIVAAVCLLTNPKEKPDEDDVSTDTPVTDTQTEEQFTREFYHEFVANSYNWLSEDKLQELISDAAYAEDALPLLVLNSPAEVEAFIEKYDEDMGLTRNDSTGVNVAAQMREAYTQAFFDRNILLAVYYKDGSCSVEPRIVGAKYTEGGDTMQVLVEVYEPYMQDEALGQWFMLFGIKRSVTEGITDFTAAVRGHVPTDHYAAAFARAVKAPADGKELWRTWFSDEEEVYLRSMMKRLNWETKDLKGKKSFFIGSFYLYGKTCYVGSQYDILVSDDQMAYLTEADGEFLREMLQPRKNVTTVPPYAQTQMGDLVGDAPEERSYFTGKMIEWSKAKQYFLLEVTRADAAELVGKKVKVSTARLEAGSVPVIGSSVDVEYDGTAEAGNPPTVYALDLEKTDSDQLGGPDDDEDDGRFTGKVVEVADGRMRMECHDKKRFDTVWVYLTLCPDLKPKVGDEYTVYHADLVMETDPPEVTADHVVALSSTPTSTTTESTTTTKPTTTTTKTSTTTTKSTAVSTTTTTSTTAPKKTTTKSTTTKTTAVSTTESATQSTTSTTSISGSTQHTHMWSEWEATKMASPVETGVQVRACTGCDATEKQIIEKMDGNTAFHDWRMGHILDNNVPSRLTAGGLVAYAMCYRTGQRFTGEELISILEEQFVLTDFLKEGILSSVYYDASTDVFFFPEDQLTGPTYMAYVYAYRHEGGDRYAVYYLNWDYDELGGTGVKGSLWEVELEYHPHNGDKYSAKSHRYLSFKIVNSLPDDTVYCYDRGQLSDWEYYRQ